MANTAGPKKALVIHAIMNSSMEDIINFKTACCFKLSDQNLEIHVENSGQVPVTVPSYFDLENEQGIKRIDTLFPPGWQMIAPGDKLAFYCHMDETTWNSYKRLVFYDRDGARYICHI
jgi:hypothetical protein